MLSIGNQFFQVVQIVLYPPSVRDSHKVERYKVEHLTVRRSKVAVAQKLDFHYRRRLSVDKPQFCKIVFLVERDHIIVF